MLTDQLLLVSAKYLEATHQLFAGFMEFRIDPQTEVVHNNVVTVLSGTADYFVMTSDMEEDEGSRQISGSTDGCKYHCDSTWVQC